MRSCGNTKPELTIAARTRSRASRTALSASPTTANMGSPRRMSTSTHTRRASTPSRAKVSTRARLMRAPKAVVRLRDHGGSGTSRATASERVLEMIEADECVAVVHEHADRVEADAFEERQPARVVEPEAGDLAHLAALAPVQAVPRLAVAEPAGLDLGEDQRLAVDRDDVELAEARLVVAGDDPPAEPLEVVGGALLAEAAERLAGVRWHRRRR